MVSDLNGGADMLTQGSVLATNEHLHRSSFTESC